MRTAVNVSDRPTLDRAGVKALVQAIARSVFRLPDLTVPDHGSFETIDGWDSMAQVQVIIELEDQLKITFSEDEVEGLVDVDLLVDATLRLVEEAQCRR